MSTTFQRVPLREGDRLPGPFEVFHKIIVVSLPSWHLDEPHTIPHAEDHAGVIRYIELAPAAGGGAREQRALFPN